MRLNFRFGADGYLIFIYVDVDNTLVRTVRGTELPIPKVVRHIKKLHHEGALLYCSVTVARTMLAKPHNVWESMRVSLVFSESPKFSSTMNELEEWPCVVDVHPNCLATLKRYKARLQRKEAANG